MAWNEPGGQKGKDPWGGQGGDGQGPPDLDEVVRKLQEKVSRFFGGKRRGGKSVGGGGGRGASFGIGTIVAVVLALWALSGLYVVDQGKRGVVLRFGQYYATTEAGLHWRLRPVDTVEIVDVEAIRTAEVGYRSAAAGQATRPMPRESLMLTQDENIVDIKLAVQYRVKDPKEYLFNVKDPDETLKQATESALREVVGKSTMDFALTEGRAEIVASSGKLIQEILDHYQTGLEITSVNMQDAQPPEEVQGAFNDAVKAREDEVRLRNEAEAYSNEVIPRARGQAARVLEEANAYQAQVVAQSEGDASRFTQVLKEYKLSPSVTRERMYLDTVESVLSNASKILVDVKGGNNLLYLPLDRLLQERDGQRGTTAPASTGQQSGASSDEADERARMSLRSREVR